MADPVLELAGISKRFGTTHALQEVSFSCQAGEIHALLGENGAGKSTLIKIVTGVLKPDEGTARFLGSAVPFGHPGRVTAAGLSTVYQDLSLVPGLTVASNFYLGEPRMFFAPSRLKERKVGRVLAEFGLTDIAPTDLVDSLSFGQRQRLEIVRALNRNPRVLLLDEPTSALSRPEVEWLFALLRTHRERGAAIVFISHRMGEIRGICDRVTVLRNGQNVGTRDADSVNDGEIVQLMLGRSLAAAFPTRPERSATQPGAALAAAPVLEVRELAVAPLLTHVNFSLNPGEVLGIAGLDGQGQRLLLGALAGTRRVQAGEILRRGRPVRIGSPAASIRNGIALIPADRAREGLIMPLSVCQNMSLPVIGRFTRFGLIREAEEKTAVVEMASVLDLGLDRIQTAVGNLSGGNQQKVLLGKWLMTGAEAILLDDPTQGVDVGTKFEIGVQILRLATEGRGVLLYSTDLSELAHLADRVLVFYQGRIAAELQGSEMTEEAILMAMTGHGRTATGTAAIAEVHN